jgi:hypothetical protein
VVFAKRRSRRTPLQRLSDQRRGLALGGLAVGAIFSGAIFRRRRHRKVLRPEPPAMVRPEESTLGGGAPPASPTPIEVPAPASEPEVADAPRPINAAPATEGVAAAGPASASSSTLEPATGELSVEEARILAVLAQSGRVDDERTAIAVAASLERDAGDVTDVLRKLGAEGVVSGGLRTSAGEEIWAVTERGVRRLGAQS